MNTYQQYWVTNTYYTSIPDYYFQVNPKISTWQYVQDKMKTKEITPTILEKACSMYPEIFVWYKLGYLLRPYQHFALDIMVKDLYIALAWARRLGKTSIVRFFILWSSLYNKFPGTMTGTTWNIILQDADLANALYIEPLHEYIERGDKITYQNFRGELGDQWFSSQLVTKRDKFGKVKANQITLKTPTGNSRINTMGPTNKAIGREGNIIGDEVAKWKDNPKCKDEFVFYHKLISIMKDNPGVYRAIFLSTPEGESDVFAKEIFDPENLDDLNKYTKIWFPYTVRTDEPWINEMEIMKKDAERKGKLYLFQQEQEAKFVTVANAWFSNIDKINNSIKQDILASYELKHPCSLGIDWGGTLKSETVLTIVRYTFEPNHHKQIIFQKAYPVNEDYGVLDDIRKLKQNYNIKFCIPDNKGGRFLIPKLEDLFGKHRVMPLNFTTDKLEGYELFRQQLYDNQIDLPNIKELIEQMKTLTDKLKPAHSKAKDDRVDSVMLALYPFIKDNKREEFRVIDY